MGDLIHWFAASFIGKIYLGFVIVSATGMVAFLANVLVDRFTTIQKERDSIEGDIKDIPIEDIEIEEVEDFSAPPQTPDETTNEDLDYLKQLVNPFSAENEGVVENEKIEEKVVETPADFTIVDFIDVIENDDVHQRSFSDSDGENPYPRSFNEDDETF